MIVQYLKNNKGQRVGCLVGTEAGIGWSKVHGKLDTFSRSKGLQIALGRAYKRQTFVMENIIDLQGKIVPAVVAKAENGHTTVLPKLVVKNLPAFTSRFKKYYKYDPF